MEKLATLRSHYSLEQFEEVLQDIAHKAAIEQVKNLRGGRIDLGDGRIREISSPHLTITFGSSIHFHTEGSKGLAFAIEEKMYQNSNHKTKISFQVYIERHYDEKLKKYIEDENKAEKEREMAEKIQAFTDKLMQEYGIVPVARFSYKQMKRT